MTTRNKLQNYPTAELAWLKITALQRKLGLPETPEANMEPFMDSYLALVDSLEDQLLGNAAAAPTLAAPTIPVPVPPKVDPPAPTVELRGIPRAAQAQRSGKTAKPTATLSVPTTGWGRAARAQEALNLKSKS